MRAGCGILAMAGIILALAGVIRSGWTQLSRLDEKADAEMKAQDRHMAKMGEEGEREGPAVSAFKLRPPKPLYSSGGVLLSAAGGFASVLPLVSGVKRQTITYITTHQKP